MYVCNNLPCIFMIVTFDLFLSNNINMAQKSFLIVFFILLSFLILIKGQNYNTYNKLDHIEEEEGLQAHKFLTNIVMDSTSIIIMIKMKDQNCTEPRIIFRILYPDGRIKPMEAKNEFIPDFNFCKFNEQDEIIKWYPIQQGQLFITYLNSSKISDASYYGLLISWDGTVLR